MTMRAPKNFQEFQIETQKQIGPYRVDFLFTATSCKGAQNTSTLVVECDGHDFHERTKEQARNDRSRDRALQEMGHTVFRFTGSEIYRAPLACARQIFRWIDNATWKDVG
jgi:very-short-patch-repair endonuclease